MAGSRQLALLMALGCCAAACCGGALAAAAPPPPSVATLVTMAKVSAAMYPPKGTLAGAVDGAFSDCARPHAPRRGFQAAAAAEIAALLKASPGDVTFFDLNVPAQAQFCHAAVVALTPSGAAAAGLPGSGPAAVVAFRGSSNIAAAAADLDKDSIPQQFRGKTVEVHKGFAASLLAPPAPNSCAMAGTGPVPDSCAAALQAHLESLSKAAGGAGPLRVAVTGHSLGAAEAALFALVLDGSPAKFAVTAYTYGQPKIGRGKGWRGVYDGPRGLSGRTFRVVHGADPVPMLASACQTRFSTKEEYEQIGQLIRVRSGSCPITKSADGPKGACSPPPPPGGAAECTIEPESAFDDCSIWVGQGAASGKNDMCFCGALPTKLLSKTSGLWGDHETSLYVAGLSKCGGVKASPPGALPWQGGCAKGYKLADFCGV